IYIMTFDEDLKNLERKMYLSFCEDGLFDIYFGILYIGFGLSLFLSEISFLLNYITLALMVCVGMAILLVGKRRITIPRIGFVRFGKKRKLQKKRLVILLFCLVIITTIGLFGFSEFLPDYVLAFVIGFCFSLPMLLAAYLTKVNRYYFYALLGGIIFFIEELLIINTGIYLYGSIAVFSVSSVIIAIGILLLIKFIKKFPISSN
ncbi:MAG: hypothetical protein JW891_06290, partial [Candidatus Lokiarchaeota archaeon]|nr:hypothetical protein [Candidatus Lokiarchaeota archaeon]